MKLGDQKFSVSLLRRHGWRIVLLLVFAGYVFLREAPIMTTALKAPAIEASDKVYTVDSTFEAGQGILRFTMKTNFPDGTRYRAGLYRKITDVGALHESRYDNAGYFSPRTPGEPDPEAGSKDNASKTPQLSLGVVKNQVMTGNFELFAAPIQAYNFGFDPQKMIVDKNNLTIVVDVEKDFPEQPFEIKNGPHLFYKFEFTTPNRLDAVK